jgi:hypothetical protein
MTPSRYSQHIRASPSIQDIAQGGSLYQEVPNFAPERRSLERWFSWLLYLLHQRASERLPLKSPIKNFYRRTSCA